MKHHKKFKNFRPPVVLATKQLVGSKPWREDGEQHRKFQTWLDAVAPVYDVPIPRLTIAQDEMHAQELLDHTTEQDIILIGFSVITLLHVFRHYLHMHGYEAVGEPEADALGWSCSLFYTVAPRTFRKAVRAGRVQGVTPADLLSRSTLETVQMLDEAGYILLAEEIAYNGWSDARRHQVAQILHPVEST